MSISQPAHISTMQDQTSGRNTFTTLNAKDEHGHKQNLFADVRPCKTKSVGEDRSSLSCLCPYLYVWERSRRNHLLHFAQITCVVWHQQTLTQRKRKAFVCLRCTYALSSFNSYLVITEPPIIYTKTHLPTLHFITFRLRT